MADRQGDRAGLDAAAGRLEAVVASALVDAAPDGTVMVDEQGQILFVNRQLEELFGYGRDDLVGHPVEVLLPEGLRQSHRADRIRFRAEPRIRPMGAGQWLFGRRRDGVEFPVEVSLSPLRMRAGLRVIAAVRDITQRMATEAETREIRRVVDATRDAVLMFDRETLRFTYVNQGAIGQLGYSRDELLTMTLLEIDPAFIESEYWAIIARLSAGESYTYITVHRRKDGTDIPVEAMLQHPAADRPGGPGWIVLIARDMTERLEVERRAQAAEREVAVLEDGLGIVRDLHDRVIQRLFAAGLGIEAIRGRVSDQLTTELLQQVVGDLDGTIRELRLSIFELGSVRSARSLRDRGH
jgi:PAS domain S-box-containing protein